MLPLSIRARWQTLCSGELVQFSMKMRFAFLRVPTAFFVGCARRQWVCAVNCVYVLCLMSAGGWHCLQMWALGNHKTQSLWSIPEPLPLYITFSSSTHSLSLHVSLTRTHYFSMFFHLFSLLPLPLLIPVLHLPLPHSLSRCGLLYITVVCLCLLDIYLVSSHFPLFLNPLPPSSTLTNTSLFLSLSAPHLPSTYSSVLPFSSPPVLPSITCEVAVGGAVLIPRLADRHGSGWLAPGVCANGHECVWIRTHVCMRMYSWLFKEHSW